MTVSPIDTSTFVKDTWEAFSWRMMSNCVSPWERERLHERITDWSQWCAAWSEAAAEHVARGDEAAAAGHAQTAAAAFITAGLFYHWASFLFTHDAKQFRTALENAEAAFAKAAPIAEHPMEILNVPFEGTELRGYFRYPRGASGRVPLIVLIPGADSTKEELYDHGAHMLRRGVAVYCFDGPGHGLVSFDLKLRREYENPIGAVLDVLLERKDVDADRVALGGISYGGQFAIRGAAFDPRVRAAVSVSSWYSAAGRFPSQLAVSKLALVQYLGPDPMAVQNTMTLEGVAERVTVPVLQVYGGRDKASPIEQAQRIAAAVKGPHLLKFYEDGVHVCNNLWYQSRPFTADWVAGTLRSL
jgi:2,6-dihydroxypseudooxynicotine hydrolase